MKTLNRPMFRYGGPIKEGVMNGIREPKKHGGSMGTRKAALVGNPMFPQTDGRAHHALPLMIPMAVGAAARFAAPLVGNFVRRRMPQLLKSGAVNINKKGITKFKPRKFDQEGFEPNRLGKFFVNDPLAKAAVSGAGFAGKAIQKVGGGIKYATTTPSGLLFLGAPVTVAAGRYFLSDGKEIKDPNDIKKITQGDTSLKGGGADTEPRVLSEAEQEKIESDNRIKQMDTYEKIMDIKGMKKDATYKALIDASQLITQEGDFKGSIKDGSLIAKLIGATSKRFDKVSDTRTALRSLVAKGEIDKELNKEDKILKRKLTKTQLALAEKGLAGDSFEEAILKKITSTSGKMPTGSDLAGILKATRKIDAVVLDGSKVTPGGEINFVQKEVNDKALLGTPIDPGYYVINSKIVTVDEQGNVSQYY